jgi:hypothetical protein
LDTRGQGGLLEAACSVQRGWICEGNRGQGPTSNQSFPDEEALGCNTFCIEEDEGHRFNGNQCESQENSELNTSCRDENKGHKFNAIQYESQKNSELNTSCRAENKGHKFNVIQCESQENSELNTFCINENEGRKFSISQCESHGKSDMDRISLYFDSRDSRKLKFLIDTGTEISIIRSSSLTPGVKYQWHKGMEIKGISNTIMKTVGKTFKTVYRHARDHTHLSCFRR